MTSQPLFATILWRFVKVVSWTFFILLCILSALLLRVYVGPISLNFLKPYLYPVMKAYGLKDLDRDLDKGLNIALQWPRDQGRIVLSLTHLNTSWISVGQLVIPLSYPLNLEAKDIKITLSGDQWMGDGLGSHYLPPIKNIQAKNLSIRVSFNEHFMDINHLELKASLGRKSEGWLYQCHGPSQKRVAHFSSTLPNPSSNISPSTLPNPSSNISPSTLPNPSSNISPSTLPNPSSNISPSTLPVISPSPNDFSCSIQDLKVLMVGLDQHLLDSLVLRGAIEIEGGETKVHLQQEGGLRFEGRGVKTLINHGKIEATLSKKEAKLRASLRIKDALFQAEAQGHYVSNNLKGWAKMALVGTVEIKDLPLLWPKNRAISAREWIITNIQDGKINQLETVITFTAPNQGQLEVHTLKGSIGITKGMLFFMEKMPPITQIEATSVMDLKGFDIRIIRGLFQHHVISNGTITISPLVGVPDLALQLVMKGPLDPFIQILNHFFSLKKFSLMHIKGSNETHIRAKFPLLKALKKEEVDLSFHSQIKNASFDLAVSGKELNLTKGDLVAKGSVKSIHIQGKSCFNKIPTRWKLENDRITFRCAPSTAELKNLLGLDLAPYLTSAVNLSGTYWDNKIALKADLSENACSLPWIRWKKAPHIPLFIKLTNNKFTNKSAGNRSCNRSSNKSGYLVTINGALQGHLHLSSKGVPTYARLQAPDNFLEYTFDTHQHRLLFRGSVLDFTGNKSDGEPKGKEGNKEGNKPIYPHRREWVSVDLFCKKVLLNGLILSDGRVHLQGHTLKSSWYDVEQLKLQRGWASAKYSSPNAVSDAKKVEEVTFSANPEKNHETLLELKATDSGSLLNGLGITSDVQGGNGHLKARQKVDGSYVGVLDLFHLDTRAPVLGKLLALASPTLITEFFSSGLAFHHARVKFSYHDKQVSIFKAVGKGINLGLYFQGSLNLENDQARLTGVIVPSYLLNTFFSKLPIIGWLLGGKKGLFSAEFTLKGPLDNPTIRVKPLSILKIGFIKNLFVPEKIKTESFK